MWGSHICVSKNSALHCISAKFVYHFNWYVFDDEEEAVMNLFLPHQDLPLNLNGRFLRKLKLKKRDHILFGNRGKVEEKEREFETNSSILHVSSNVHTFQSKRILLTEKKNMLTYCLRVSYSFIFDSFGASQAVYRNLCYIKSLLWKEICLFLG